MFNPKLSKSMKSFKLVSMLFFSVLTTSMFSQFEIKDEFDLIQLGAGNYFGHYESEGEVRSMINSVVKYNRFPKNELLFNKGKNLFHSSCMVNPRDDHFTYFIYSVRVQEGFDLYFLYCQNELTHFFDYNEGSDLFRLKYRPDSDGQKMLTNLPGELIVKPKGR